MSSPKVLLISSVNPLSGPAKVALDYYRAFLSENVSIDFLTLYPVEGWPDILSVYKNESAFRRVVNKAKYWITGLRKALPGYHFFYSYEQLPPVPVKDLLNSINKEYDLVLILFWQEMLSFSSVKALYEKLHCQIHFMGVDYSQMSGGCHFTRDCSRFQVGCGYCPAISSNRLKDFTYFNVKYREQIYKDIKPIVYGNTYMRDMFYKKSYLLNNARVEPSYDIYDLNEFYPIDKQELRQKYGIPDSKKFIIFFGCQDLNEPRKGMSYLFDSLDVLWGKLQPEERSEVLICIAGRSISDLDKKVKFEYNYLGYVPINQMPELYSLADVYLSPSIDDAGPTMVNQSLCCGTPVVAFEMGTALESIKGNERGYCAKLRDVEDFAYGIYSIMKLSSVEKDTISKKCREYAEKHFSYRARVSDIINIYLKYNSL